LVLWGMHYTYQYDNNKHKNKFAKISWRRHTIWKTKENIALEMLNAIEDKNIKIFGTLKKLLIITWTKYIVHTSFNIFYVPITIISFICRRRFITFTWPCSCSIVTRDRTHRPWIPRAPSPINFKKRGTNFQYMNQLCFNSTRNNENKTHVLMFMFKNGCVWLLLTGVWVDLLITYRD